MVMFVDGKKRLLLKSYTAWAFYTLAIVTLLPDAIYLLTGVDTNPAMWTVIQAAVVVFGAVGRFVLQTRETRTKRAFYLILYVLFVLVVALPAIAKEPTYAETSEVLVPLVKQWEGKHPCPDDPALHCSYFDTIARPPLWTVGYGHTQTAERGQRLTEAQASAMLGRDLFSYWQQVRRGFTPATISERLTPERDAAFSSLGYNVGPAGVRKSTATRRLNKGNIAGACQALTWWNKAGGRVVRGLVNRRQAEYDLCMEGL